MADDVENDDQWLYGENPDPTPEPPKEPEKKQEEPEPEKPKESESPPKVSFSTRVKGEQCLIQCRSHRLKKQSS